MTTNGIPRWVPGAVIYEIRLRPVTRTFGFGSAPRRRSSAEHRRHLAELGPFFLDDRKFMSPPQFLEELRNTIARGIREIPSVIARDGGFPEDTARAAAIWREMQDTGITIFQFSPGGDRVVVIGWSQRDRRFYDLLECCWR